MYFVLYKSINSQRRRSLLSFNLCKTRIILLITIFFLQDFIKVMRWGDRSFWSLWASVEKSHKAIFKQLRAWDTALSEPAACHLSLPIKEEEEKATAVRKEERWLIILFFCRNFRGHGYFAAHFGVKVLHDGSRHPADRGSNPLLSVKEQELLSNRGVSSARERKVLLTGHRVEVRPAKPLRRHDPGHILTLHTNL